MNATTTGLFAPVPLGVSLKAYVSASSVVRGLGVVRAMVLAWLMTQQAFGTYQLGLVLSNLLLPVVSLGIHEGLLRFVPEQEARGRLGWFLVRSMGLAGLLGLAGCGVVYIAAPWIGPRVIGTVGRLASGQAAESLSPSGETLLRMVAVVVLTLIPYHAVLAVLRGRRMFRAASLMELGAGGLFTVLAVVAVLAGLEEGRDVLVTYALSCALFAGGFGVAMPWHAPQQAAGESRAAAGPLGGLLRYSVAVGLAALCWQLLLSFPALRLQRVAGRDVFATFDLMRAWTQLGFLATVAIAAPVASAVTRRWEVAGRAEALSLLDTAHKGTLVAVISGSVLLALCRDWIGWLMPAAYREGVIAGGPLLCYFLVAATLHLLVVRLTLVKRGASILGGWIVGCAVSVAASLLFIEAGAVSGAVSVTAWCSLAGCLGALVAILISARRRGVGLDRGGWVLIGGCFLPLLEPGLLAAALLAVPLVAFSTPLIFSPAERQRLWDFFLRNV